MQPLGQMLLVGPQERADRPRLGRHTALLDREHRHLAVRQSRRVQLGEIDLAAEHVARRLLESEHARAGRCQQRAVDVPEEDGHARTGIAASSRSATLPASSRCANSTSSFVPQIGTSSTPSL